MKHESRTSFEAQGDILSSAGTIKGTKIDTLIVDCSPNRRDKTLVKSMLPGFA